MPAPRPSFEALWQKLAPHVRAAVLRCRPADSALDADDLLQEVRIRVWQVWQGDRKSQLRASYYYKVVNSAMVDALRRHRGTLAGAQREHDDGLEERLDRIDSPEPGPDHRLADDHRRRRLAAALGALPAERRRAVGLFLQGFTVPEIAELMACDHDRAHNLTYRGIRALKRTMSDDDG
ncbi:MAG: sigma-70 family RNA polymerase sigma factor [Wenzhouxiangellaceae bacterium]|nr:sigma-70 family RNA polymerase sigma factor [Wenzhouxiangellaceae bacterium]